MAPGFRNHERKQAMTEREKYFARMFTTLGFILGSTFGIIITATALA